MQRRFFRSILAGFVFAFSSNAVGQPLTVFVHNYAAVGEPKLVRAETEATRVLATGGVVVHWVDCNGSRDASSQCQDSPDATELVLHLLAASATRRNAPSGALGFAVPPEPKTFGCYAGVLYDRVEHFHSDKTDKSVLLGDVMAHELGHLLLGVGGHSSSGIMKAEWQGKELQEAAQGTLIFREKERRRMQRNIQTRFADRPINRATPTVNRFPSRADPAPR